MPRKSIGETAMTDAERQARYRAARAAGKPVIALKLGASEGGRAAAMAHTGALAGNDKIYEDVFRQSGVIRARSLRDLLDFARGIPVLPTPKGNNVVIITGAGGSGVLLSDACVDNGLSLMAMPADLDAAFRKFIPPFGAAGNPVDITGGEPPITYVNTVKLGLSDERIHSLILGYWHTIVTPPMVFARNMVEVKNAMKAKGIEKPIVASLAGDIEVEEAADYLYQNGIVAYAYSTEIPVAVLGANNDTIRCELADPALSSVAPNAFQSGYRAAALLGDLLLGIKPKSYDQRVEPLGVVTRHSTDVLAVEDRNVAAALSFIRERACHGITVSQVLEHAHASRSQIERKFRQCIGRSPQSEIRRVQLRKIRQLLLETDFPLKRIAELTGFEHMEYMCVLFKRMTGVSPGSYRVRMQDKAVSAVTSAAAAS